MQELLEVEWGGDFVGLGLDEEVPKFLRTNAKVKNRHMSKVSFLVSDNFMQSADRMPVIKRCLAAPVSMHYMVTPCVFRNSMLASQPLFRPWALVLHAQVIGSSVELLPLGSDARSQIMEDKSCSCQP